MSTEIKPIAVADLERIVEVHEQDLLIIGKADGTKSMAIRYDKLLEKLQLQAEKGQPNGYTPLGRDGKVPEQYLPESAGEGIDTNLGNTDLEQTDQERVYSLAGGKSLQFYSQNEALWIGGDSILSIRGLKPLRDQCYQFLALNPQNNTEVVLAEGCGCSRPPITVNSFTFDAQQSGWITIDPEEEPSELNIMFNPSNLTNCVVLIKPLTEQHKLYFPDGWLLESGWSRWLDGGIDLVPNYNNAGSPGNPSAFILNIQCCGEKTLVRASSVTMINKSFIDCVLTYNISTNKLTGVFDTRIANDKIIYIRFNISDISTGFGSGAGFEIPAGVTHYEGETSYNYFSHKETPHIEIHYDYIEQDSNICQYIIGTCKVIIK